MPLLTTRPKSDEDRAKTMSTAVLNEREAIVVRLIELGFGRSRIAWILGIGETQARTIVRDLCERFDCPMAQLPEEVAMRHPIDSL
jgi:DNA-binding CsgD family transcriptional regulator